MLRSHVWIFPIKNKKKSELENDVKKYNKVGHVLKISTETLIPTGLFEQSTNFKSKLNQHPSNGQILNFLETVKTNRDLEDYGKVVETVIETPCHWENLSVLAYVIR